MVGIPYDDLDAWKAQYPADVFAAQMEKCGRGFLEGAATLSQAVEFAPQERSVDARRQARYAEVAGVNYLSVANQTRFVVARNERAALKKELAETGANAEKEARIKELTANMIELARNEIELAKRLRRADLEDSCVGFESTNQYWFVPNDLVEKVVSCLDIIERLENGE